MLPPFTRRSFYTYIGFFCVSLRTVCVLSAVPVPYSHTAPEQDLARDAPVPQVVYPVVVLALVPFRDELHFFTLHNAPHPLSEGHCFASGEECRFFDGNEPLQFRQGLHDAASTFRRRDVLLDILFFLKKIFIPKPFRHRLARFRCFLS